MKFSDHLYFLLRKIANKHQPVFNESTWYFKNNQIFNKNLWRVKLPHNDCLMLLRPFSSTIFQGQLESSLNPIYSKINYYSAFHY